MYTNLLSAATIATLSLKKNVFHLLWQVYYCYSNHKRIKSVVDRQPYYGYPRLFHDCYNYAHVGPAISFRCLPGVFCYQAVAILTQLAG